MKKYVIDKGQVFYEDKGSLIYIRTLRDDESWYTQKDSSKEDETWVDGSERTSQNTISASAAGGTESIPLSVSLEILENEEKDSTESTCSAQSATEKSCISRWADELGAEDLWN